MSNADAQYDEIIEIIKDKRLTTIEIEQLLDDVKAHCPDDLARTLNVMRRKGFIRGAVSTERGGWVWWVEDQGK